MNRERSAAEKFEAAKKRLGLKAAPLLQEIKELPDQPTDENIVFDDDGFLVGVKVPDKQVERGYYVLLDGKFAGCPILYRALLPIDYMMLKDTPITTRMTLIGLDSRNTEQSNAYLKTLSSLEINRIYSESSKLIVVEAVEKPVLTDAPPERCPPNQISIHDLSLTDILTIRRGIEALSGVQQQEATFREADAEDNADSGEPESGGEAESDDSDPDGGDVGEST